MMMALTALAPIGSVAERLMALVLKTRVANNHREFKSHRFLHMYIKDGKIAFLSFYVINKYAPVYFVFEKKRNC